MFTSLKKKIKEETGTDPTKVISSVFKGRTASDSDLDESRTRPISGVHGIENHDTKAYASVPVSPSNTGIVDKLTIPGSALKHDLKYNKHESGDAITPLAGRKLYNETGVELGISQQLQGMNGLVKPLVIKGGEEVNENITQDCRAETSSAIEVITQNHFLSQELERKTNSDDGRLTLQLRKTEEQLSKVRQQLEESNQRCAQLSAALVDEKNANAQLSEEVTRLRDDIKGQSEKFGKLGESLERELREKDVMLLRNAQLNQDVEMTKQELRLHESESSELHAKLTALGVTMMEKDNELRKRNAENEELCLRVKELLLAERNESAASQVEQELKRNIIALEEQLDEKAKSIRVLQQHSTDLKKTLQRNLKQAVDEPSLDGMTTNNSSGEPDVNFKYLKHVIMKFLTSREYEAQHLTRAVSTLLHFSPEEERLLRETLDWKMSWFGTRPQLGFGQSSKTIPPS